MSEENKALIRRLVETFNKHDVTLWDEFIAPDFVDYTIPLQGLDKFKQFETSFINGFPDYHETIEDIIAEGDTVWIHFKVTATHTGEWNLFGVPVPPTGKKVTYTGVGIWRIIDGKITERKTVRDMLEFLRQIGIIEPTEKAKQLFPENVS